MADRSNLPGAGAGQELRAIIAQRRRRRRICGIATLAALAAFPLGISGWWAMPTLLVWNASASAPIGLYHIRPGKRPARNEMVIAWTPEPWRSLAARRRYLPANVPLVKRVAAAGGDEVCADGGNIRVNRRTVATRLRLDPAGRPMPWWSGCRRLGEDEYFLLMDSASSFDGRYFGITDARQLVGRAKLLWPKRAVGSDDA